MPRAESGQARGASPQPQPQEQDLQAAWELEVWKNAEEVCMIDEMLECRRFIVSSTLFMAVYNPGVCLAMLG